MGVRNLMGDMLNEGEYWAKLSTEGEIEYDSEGFLQISERKRRGWVLVRVSEV